MEWKTWCSFNCTLNALITSNSAGPPWELKILLWTGQWQFCNKFTFYSLWKKYQENFTQQIEQSWIQSKSNKGTMYEMIGSYLMTAPQALYKYQMKTICLLGCHYCCACRLFYFSQKSLGRIYSAPHCLCRLQFKTDL